MKVLIALAILFAAACSLEVNGQEAEAPVGADDEIRIPPIKRA